MIPSPCIGRCRIDAGSRLCAGCARSGAEVAAWRDADPSDRARVWADLPRRRPGLGITLHRRGWLPEEALAFVRDSLRSSRGAWTVGELGASATIRASSPGLGPITKTDLTLTAVGESVAVRFTLDDRIRVLALPAPGARTTDQERVILAVPRTRDLADPATALTALGPDGEAIRPEDRTGKLFDLGVDRPGLRIALRTTDAQLAVGLDGEVGNAWADVLAAWGSRIARAADGTTWWVVETPLARVEVAAWLPRGPVGPFHLDPKAQMLDRATPPGVDLPPTFVPCAIFDPVTGRAVPRKVAGWFRRLAGRA